MNLLMLRIYGNIKILFFYPINFWNLEKIQNLINKVIRKIAKEQNFDLILYQKVAYASKKINITELVSQKLRRQFK